MRRLIRPLSKLAAASEVMHRHGAKNLSSVPMHQFAAAGEFRKRSIARATLCSMLLFNISAFSSQVLNVYGWGAEIPSSIIQQFEHETGIRVNFSTYDSNETMYAKLRANKKNVYDIVFPSAYYVERMRKQGIIMKLDQSKLKGLNNLDPVFDGKGYDPANQYSIPLVWGTTGIFYNQAWIKTPPTSWSQLWDKRWKNQLMMLDDIREVFSATFISLGYHPDNTHQKEIKQAYQHLVQLIPNIKLFASDAIRSIMIDEDVLVGMAWSGDVYKAQAENPNIQYIYPKDGFMIWIDCLAIPNNAPHLQEAYQFINFLLQAKPSAEITLQYGYAITNVAGKQLLPKSIQNNQTIFPSHEQLKHGYFQRDVGEKIVELYSSYWQNFKLAF